MSERTAKSRSNNSLSSSRNIASRDARPSRSRASDSVISRLNNSLGISSSSSASASPIISSTTYNNSISNNGNNSSNNSSNNINSINNSANMSGTNMSGTNMSGNNNINNSVNSNKSNRNSQQSSNGSKLKKMSDNIANSARQAIKGLDTIATIRLDNYTLVLGVTLSFVILVLLYFLSKSFNVGRSIQRMKMYPRYQKITASKPPGDTKLYQLQSASAYNAAHSGHQLFGYTSEHITRQVLRSGVRYLEFTVFPSSFGSDAIPLIGSGYKQGQWNITLNTTSFEAVIRTIAQNAWSNASSDESGSPAPEDPLIIGLNLATNGNIHCLDRMAEIILDYLYDHVLPPKYAYQHNGQEFGNIPFSALRRRVAIIASTGYQGSKLEELVNAQWHEYDATGIHTADLDTVGVVNRSQENNNQELNAVLEKVAEHKIWRIPAAVLDRPWFSEATVKSHNESGGLTIVVPHVEGDWFTQNYDPVPWWNMGCQMVTMNWQHVDEHVDTYVTHFARHSFVLGNEK